MSMSVYMEQCATLCMRPEQVCTYQNSHHNSLFSSFPYAILFSVLVLYLQMAITNDSYFASCITL